jgi:acetoacetate decarboxylase
LIPVSFRGRKGNYTHCMLLNDEGPIAGGRELWGFIPHVDGRPRICELVEYHLEDVTIKGASMQNSLDYGCSLHHSGHRTLWGVRVAFATTC